MPRRGSVDNGAMTSQTATTRTAARPPVRALGRAASLALGGFVVLSVVHLVAQWSGVDAWSNATQWFVMPVLALALWWATDAPRSRLVRLTLVALGLSWLGDSAPDLASGDAAFLLMVGFFLLAQVVYVVAFWPWVERSVLRRRRWALAPYVVAVAALLALCMDGAGALLLPVLVYAFCLAAMGILATGVNALVWAGGAVFMVSDGLIALAAFSPVDVPHSGFFVMLTYLTAQLLIVGGARSTPTGD